MKKILIAILLLVPVIIILTLNVSSTIVSAQIEIGVERLVLKHLGETVDYVVINLEEYTETNKQYLLFPEFTPTYASNKKIDWSVSDESMATIRKSGDGVAVSFIKGQYGTVDVIATAKSNTSISAVCTFVITGKVIGRIDFYDYNTLGEVKNLNLKLYESTCIEARPIPFAALGSKKIKWQSSNESVATVNQNGVINAVGEGVASITASITEQNEVVSNTLTVSVAGKALSNKPTIYSVSREVDMTEYLSSSDVEILSVENGAAAGNKITVDDNKQVATVALRKNDDLQTVNIYICEENALVIDDLDEYKKTVWANKNFVPLRTEYFPISASCPFQKTGEITWTSDNPSVATVINGRIAGLKEGTAVLTATADGFIPVSIEVDITPKIVDVRLELDSLGDIAGLNEERVFGINTCTFNGTNFNVTNSLQMRISYVYPDEVMDSENIYDYFYFESSDENLATIGDDGTVFFNREAIGKKVKITVTARFSENNAHDSYVFNVIDGINIGYDMPFIHYDKNVSEELPSYYSTKEYEYLMNSYTADFDIDGTMGAVVFQNNVYLPRPEDYSFYVGINRPIYGNGYVIDGQLHNNTYDTRIFNTGLDYDRIVKYFGNDYEMKVENLFIQSYSPISDDSEEAFKDLKVKGGIPYRSTSCSNPDIHVGLTFKYCMFRYAYCHLNIAGGPVTLDGCIMSNSAGPAITQQSNWDAASTLIIKNCIFSNTISPVYIGTTGDLINKDENLYHKYIDLRLEGINYIYNWKLVDEVSLDIFPKTNQDILDNQLIPALNDQIATFFNMVLDDPDNEALLYHGVNDYVNFGFMFLGIWRKQKLEANPDIPIEEYGINGSTVTFDENNISCSMIDMSKLQDWIDNNLIFNPVCKSLGINFVTNESYIITPIGKNGTYNTKPGDTYQLDKETKNKLHGIN